MLWSPIEKSTVAVLPAHNADRFGVGMIALWKLAPKLLYVQQASAESVATTAGECLAEEVAG